MKRALTDGELANVRAIRSNYYRAIGEGFSIEKATKIANKRYSVTDEDRARRGRANRPDLSFAATPQRVGGPSPENLASEPVEGVEIPDNYSELPWNQLRGLAKKIHPLLPVRDKGEAVGIIDAEVRRRASQKEPGQGQVDELIGFRSAPELEAEAKVEREAQLALATNTGEPGKLPDGANPDPVTGTVAGHTNVDFGNEGLKPKEIGTKAPNKKLIDPAATARKKSQGKKIAGDVAAKKIKAADANRKEPKDGTIARANKADAEAASTLPKRRNPAPSKKTAADADKTGERLEGLDK
jgi:hypothetical protein